MGMNMILSLIMGTLLTVIVGTTVVPNYINEMKISQVEEQNLSNQELIKAAIIEYIKKEAKIPKTIAKLKEKTLKDYPNSNLNDETYSFDIDKKTGTLKIFTKLDNSDLKYFENGFKSKDRPKCIEIDNNICKDGKWENFYLLDNDLYALIKSIKPDYSDPEYLGEFTPENIGKKDEHLKNPPKDGDKDYIVTINPDNEFDVTIVEKEYDANTDTWIDNGDKTPNGGLGYKNGVEIKLVDVPYHVWNEETNQLELTSEKHEKIICNATSIDKEVFVINQITGLGEIVWVALNNTTKIKNKIFGVGHNNTSPVVYTPNNICTSNVKDMEAMFFGKTIFNQPLSRWDTSNVKNMENIFQQAKLFNQNLDSWNTSNVVNMNRMFYSAENFNNGDTTNIASKPLNLDTSRVENMQGMFYNAISFNQSLNTFKTLMVTSMVEMFRGAKSFNQNLNNWDTKNVKYMNGLFYEAILFNNGDTTNIASKPLNWDTSGVENMSSFFKGATSFNQSLLNFNTSSVIDMSNMFDNAKIFNQPVNHFDTKNVKYMNWMFANMNDFNHSLNNFNTNNVLSMNYMFYKAKSFNQNIRNWCVSNILNKPTDFDYIAKFFEDHSIQPDWGTCPPNP